MKARAQDHLHACYAKKITKAEATINWNNSAYEIFNQVRAFVPWPVCHTYFRGQRLRIWQCKVEPSPTFAPPGTVIARDPCLQVQCGKAMLSIVKLQRDGGKVMSSQEFCNGYHVTIGELMGTFPNNPNG